MPLDILMPALSPTMKRGKIARWVKKEGDLIEPGEVIAEIETDKAIMEVEAVDSGVLVKILVPEGTENVPVNAKIAILLEEGEQIEDFHEESAPRESVQQFSPTEAHPIFEDPLEKLSEPQEIQSAFAAQKIETILDQETKRVFASPLAKRIAKEREINLTDLKGSGPNGRIMKFDVLNSVDSLPQNSSQVLGGSFTEASANLGKVIGHSSMRSSIAQKMSLSKREIPHFYLSLDCCVDSLLKLRTSVNNDLKSNISIGDFVLKASAYALKKVSQVNSSWSERGVIIHENIDVCVAVGLDDGLITPVIFQTDKKNLLQISLEVKDLATKARERKLMPKDYQGGSFTVSNLGMYGISDFNAIINHPQSAILAVGAIRQEVCVNKEDASFVAKNLMKVTLSCDHRVIDGTVGAQWLGQFKDLIERPLQLML
jgi:pyruvate dehydrogenase E2 component (dihydrolipoamide acetyltransferase)